ncbi:MAG: ECF transporter S component [Firmicutes bacterium]|nr:ECF transporter S component [Bacillota bacterium]
MTRTDKVYSMVMTALITGLILLATATFRIPSPFTQGYVHLGDTIIFLGVLVLGKKNGTAAAGLGSALADVMAGYAIYAPWTLIIKGLMALVMAVFIENAGKKGKNHVKLGGIPLIELLGMILGGLVMVAGYSIVDGVFAGNMASGLLGVPANIGQFAVGMILAGALAAALYKTPAKRYFAYRLDEIK